MASRLSPTAGLAAALANLSRNRSHKHGQKAPSELGNREILPPPPSPPRSQARDVRPGRTTELSDAGGPARPHWQLMWPARVRSSDFDTVIKALLGLCYHQRQIGRGVLPALPALITVNGCPTTLINNEVLHAMKYYTSTTEYNCGIDLHARQMYVCVMDRQGKNWSTPMSKTTTSIISSSWCSPTAMT